MNFLYRANNGLYKTYKECSVEYHAGGFFLRKEAIYMLLQTNNSLFFFERSEGLHPYDNDYSKLLNGRLDRNNKKFELINVNNNIAIFKNGMEEIKMMPSVFSENYNDERLTELLIDFLGKNTRIFSLVFNSTDSST